MFITTRLLLFAGVMVFLLQMAVLQDHSVAVIMTEDIVLSLLLICLSFGGLTWVLITIRRSRNLIRARNFLSKKPSESKTTKQQRDLQ